MTGPMPPYYVVVSAVVIICLCAWVGHACLWTASLNHFYGRAISKKFLKPYRLFCGIMIVVGFPLLLWLVVAVRGLPLRGLPFIYFVPCAIHGGIVFPIITLRLYFRPVPKCVVASSSIVVDYWKQHGQALLGDGKWRWLPRLPGSCIFRVEFTRTTLAVPDLPTAWEGLQVLLLSDFHFHGTPSRLYFDSIIDDLLSEPEPDLVLLAGDYVDTDKHSEWIVPLLGRLKAKEGKFAVLGNHDEHHQPDTLRERLREAGYEVLGNGSMKTTIRGVPCEMVGHEGPWFAPVTTLGEPSPSVFRWLVAHTPDAFYWAQRHGIKLMVAGHVHGGQIRLPLIGSIFVPSIYGRRFDQGIFNENGMILAVSRGLSGKEPLRYNCLPQALRLTLRIKE